MLLSSVTQQTLKKYFPLSFYQRGYDYYCQSYVQNLKTISLTGAEQRINATVIGSGSNRYQVTVEISGTQNSLYIHGICSCPIAINCKHVVATILAAIDHYEADTPYHSQHDNTLALSQDHRVNHRVDHWLAELDRMLTTKPMNSDVVDGTYSLRYLLSIADNNPGQLQLKLVLVRQLKAGGLGVPKDYNLGAYSQGKYLYPVDKELIIKLKVMNELKTTYSRGFFLEGEMGEKLLPELLATNRCHWQQPNNPSLTLAPLKTAKLKWHINDNGFQQLNHDIDDIKESQRDYVILPINQLWYLNTITGEVGLLETELDQRITKLLLSAPQIPPEQAYDVAELLRKHEELVSIVPPKVFIKTQVAEIKPIPCLRLLQIPLKVPGDDISYYQPMQVNKAVAELTFDYQGVKVAWQDQSNVIHQINNDELIKIMRNKQIEQQAFMELVVHPVILIKDARALATIKFNAPSLYYFLIKDHHFDPLDFSIQVLPLLRAKGWQIEVDEDYPYQIIDEPIEDWYSAIDESSGYDWFSLELGIIIKGEKINLLPVLQELIKKIKTNQQQLDSTKIEPILARLPDGRFIALPTERVHNILNTLIELYDSESLHDGASLRLEKLQAARLMELEAGMGAAQLRWFGGDSIRKFGERLTRFDGIKSVDVPKEFHGQLRPYQMEGLNWLQFLREYELSGILADDMGLGKTIQALSHLLVEKMSGRMTLPTLVIAPTSLMYNWFMEAQRFAPNLQVLVLHGPQRKQHFSTLRQYDLIFSTYPLLVHDKEVLLQHEFHFLILDEAQFIKNSKSRGAQIVQQIKAKYRLCLTGTPLENHLGELWSLFHFMMPGLLGDERTFNRLFRIPIEKYGDQERHKHLGRRIAPFLLRRTKDNVVKELPEKVMMTQIVELEGEQRDLYETIRVTMQQKVRQEIAKLGLARSHIIILDALLKLRQVCCDPRLLKIDVAEKSNAKSAKLELLMTLLPELLEEGRHILLFSQFTEMLGMIEDELAKRNIIYVKLTGKTKDRATPVQKFQSGAVSLFLISLKAGGTGLNLTAADTVIHYDPWWNPAVENQATDRAHRIGQEKTVFVYKLVAKGTVEEKILQMQQKKSSLMRKLFAEGAAEKEKLTGKEFQELFEPLDS